MMSNGFVGTRSAFRIMYVLGQEGGAGRVLHNPLRIICNVDAGDCGDAMCWIFEVGRIGGVRLGLIAELRCIWDLVGREDVGCTPSKSTVMESGCFLSRFFLFSEQ